MKTLKIKIQYRKGFGLLEVLISAVIIIMILAALVFIGRAALSNNEYLAERAQAVYLSQEGIELTRQIRDTNWIDGNNTSKWNTFTYNSATSQYDVTADGDYQFTYNTTELRMLLTGSSGEVITIDGVDFTRKIHIASITATTLLPNSSTDLKPYAKKITSTVTWSFSGQSRSIVASEILTNWRPDF